MGNVIKKINTNKPIIYLIFFSLITVLSKWFASFYFFPGESFNLKNILDLGDIYYFPYILNILELDFKPIYIENVIPKNYLPMPFFSIITHSLFYLFFSSYAFVILEFLSLTIFLLLLFNIFKEIKFFDYSAILMTLLLFLVIQLSPYIISKLDLTIVNQNVLSNLFSFRFPRPLITSLYFFSALLLLIKIYKSQFDNNLLLYLLLGFFLGFNFISFYYNFIPLGFITFFVLIKKSQLSPTNKIRFFFKNSFFIFLTFCIALLPFVFLLIYSEPDFLERMGAVDLSLDQKKYLLFYIVEKLIKFEFLFLFIINSLLFAHLIKEKSIYCKKSIQLLFLLFVGAILSPILFITFSPAISEIRHFLNLIVYTGFFVFIIYLILSIYIFSNKKIKLNYDKLRSAFLIVTPLIAFLLLNLSFFDSMNEKDKFIRKDLIKLDNFFQANKSRLNNIQSFEPIIQVWWLLKGNKNLITIDASMTAYNQKQLELNLIQNLKFLNIDKDTFSLMLKNKKTEWRIDNILVKYFSWYTYTANSLVTFNNSINFEDNLYELIKKTPPTRSQQIAIPIEEHNRLLDLYKNYNNKFTEEIDVIVLRKKTLIEANAIIDDKKYCKIKNTKRLSIFINKNKASCN